MNYDKLINFRWGSEPQADRVKHFGLSKKWMFIKPDVGNLSAACQTPFSSFCVIPYFGGYPTGFSTCEYCAWSTPEKISNDKLVGFTHYAFSGCGDLHHFHNYFLVRPSYEKQGIIEEKYSLDGFYIKTCRYLIDVRVSHQAAKYQIASKEDVTLIPGYSGLLTLKYNHEIVNVKIESKDDIIQVFADYGFISLYWVIKLISGKILKITSNEIVLSPNCEFILGSSIDNFDKALEYVTSFSSSNIEKAWNELFDIFELKGEEEYIKLFYTSLMFALKKPYIYDDKRVFDFATMWDIYKTLLPLICLFYKEKASAIINYMLTCQNEDGLFYHVNYFSKDPLHLSDQAICLMNITISTAYLYNVKFDYELAKKVQKREIEYYLSHLKDLKRTTYMLDLCDAIVAYYNAYQIDLGLDKVKSIMHKAFDLDMIYLDQKYEYYEGNYSNYSFRVSSSTIYRLKNIEKLSRYLDKFFGFSGIDSIRFTKPTSPAIVKVYMKKCKRFEGLNNEPDMESMYLYSYLGQYDKQNKVIYDVVNNSFSLKNNGVPGNDDNGGISSWLSLNLLGIFPVVGTSTIKIGLPFFDEVKVKNITIKRYRKDKSSLDIEKVTFNGQILKNNEIDVSQFDCGGLLEIYLK